MKYTSLTTSNALACFILKSLRIPYPLFLSSYMTLLSQFNSKFDRRTLKYMRIYLKQPSPSWLDYTLRNITLYMKKNELKFSQPSSYQMSAAQQSRELTPFEQLKQNIRTNLKGLKKEEEEGTKENEQVLSNGGHKRVSFYQYGMIAYIDYRCKT